MPQIWKLVEDMLCLLEISKTMKPCPIVGFNQFGARPVESSLSKKKPWQISLMTWDWFQNPQGFAWPYGKMTLWHALFFCRSGFFSHIRGNVAGRTWANVQGNEHWIVMSQVMRAESWLILSIRTKSWEVCPLNRTNHRWLCAFFESFECVHMV